MNHARLIQDTAAAAALSTAEQFSGLVREEERGDLRELLFEHFRAALETFVLMLERENRRLLRPSTN